MVLDVRPTFRTVSIIPGIETGAPDRTESKRGFSPPKEAPTTPSVFLIYFLIFFFKAKESFLFFKKSLQRRVARVNPGGTGRPSLHISAMFAPFPPRISGIDWSPSVFVCEKKYIFCLKFIIDTFVLCKKN